jgi:hypothetical protein
MSVASSKAKLAGLVAHRDPADPDIEVARARLAEANAEADVASWPPLSLETRAKIACVILSAGSDAT